MSTRVSRLAGGDAVRARASRVRIGLMNEPAEADTRPTIITSSAAEMRDDQLPLRAASALA
mgnify:CR=1 FL=1